MPTKKYIGKELALILMGSLPNKLNVHTCLISSNVLKSYRDAVQGKSGGFKEQAHIPALAPPPVLTAWPHRKPVPILWLNFSQLWNKGFKFGATQSQKLNFSFPEVEIIVSTSLRHMWDDVYGPLWWVRTLFSVPDHHGPPHQATYLSLLMSKPKEISQGLKTPWKACLCLCL